jgi:hypothetical protein
MAISLPFNRPLTAQTASEASSQAAAITEGASFWYVDVTATVNSQLRLLSRIKVTPETVGPTQRYKLELLNFTGEADQTFTAGAVSGSFAEAAADSKTLIGYSSFVNLHTLYVTAGDTTAS